MLKALIKKGFAAMGYELIKKKPDNQGFAVCRTMKSALDNLVKLGLHPQCVIDVGVGNGTHDLYQALPDAFHLLVEPLEEFKQPIEEILSKYNGAWEQVAASNEETNLTMNIHQAHFEGSTIFKESIGSFADGSKREVSCKCLDTIVDERKLKGPYVIKADAQGAEKKTLEGASGILPETEVVILEVSMFNFLIGAPAFTEMIAFMDSRGFALYDIHDLSYRPLDNALAQVDLVFVKSDGAFRAQHIFADVDEFKDSYAKK